MNETGEGNDTDATTTPAPGGKGHSDAGVALEGDAGVELNHGARHSSLDIGDADLRDLAARVVALVVDYFARVAELPIFPAQSAAQIGALLPDTPPAAADALEDIFADCRRLVEGSRHNGHPRFFGYVASPATAVGAFADLLASALNQNVPAWRSAPAATQIEHTVVNWLATLLGYPAGAGGLLTSGGSMANLNALYVAHRTAARRSDEGKQTGVMPDADVARAGLWRAARPATVYVSEQAHLSLVKAADVLGLGRDQARLIKTDARYRMDVRDLRERIEADLRNGYAPFCVAATAGTVNTSAVDPLNEIAEVATAHQLWLHVDGAYGAPAALDASKRALFAGLERADSITLDPHKWLYAPVDCGCLLFREPARARAAWAMNNDADYLKIFEQEEAEAFAFFDYGIELSRRFRALKLWLMLRYYGVRRVAEAISDDNRLAAYLAARVEAAPDFELLAPVELSICCFRYVPEHLCGATDAELNALNERVLRAVQRGGRAYLSNALLDGRFALRACIINFRTTPRDLDQTLDIIRAAGTREATRNAPA